MSLGGDRSENVDRHFVATAFVYWCGRVLLHRHPKLSMWLPCGGHVEPGETPDEAAVREVLEESGVTVEIVGERALEVDEPKQLVRPRGVQVEKIAPLHEHVDFIYFAQPVEPFDGTLAGSETGFAWFDEAQAASLPLTEEMRCWLRLVFAEMSEPLSERSRSL